ncbi:MAG: beta-ketoacyl-ACP synthase 3 [Alphaproteobacteria bacterium]|nr:beta-ketoacyl-ACP synthase 3 [Alphaproteobacteria bacterium]
MPNAYIRGAGGYVPPTVVTNEDLSTRYGLDTSDAWIQKRTGIQERRFAEAGVGSTHLGYEAAKAALADAAMPASELDMILFATLSPRHAFPGNGVYLGEMLGLCEGPDARFVPAMDIRNQCSGFVYGLGTAAAMVQSGACRNVLVVGAECHSAALDLSTRGRTVASLFGDGGGAVVVSATEEDRGVRYWRCGSDGRYADVLAQKVWDVRERPFIPEQEDAEARAARIWAQMDGRQVFRHAVERMAFSVIGACQELGITGEDVDLFLFHQANLRINQYVARQLGIPDEKLVHNIERYGNTTAATIPLLMAEASASGRLQRGMKVACVAFGSGFTWGTVILDW